MSTQNNTIAKGPSKSDLIFSLFDMKVVTFYCNSGNRTAGPIKKPLTLNEKIQVRVTSLEKEDGSGNKWNFKAVTARDSTLVSGFYDDSTEKGHIVFPEKKFVITERTTNTVKKM